MKTCFYRLSKIVVNQINPNSIPYIYYGIIKGPHGGQIFCDYYNLQRIFRATKPGETLGLEQDIIGYGNEKGILIINHPDKDRIAVEKPDEYKCVLAEDSKIRIKLIRNRNEKLYNKIINLFKY